MVRRAVRASCAVPALVFALHLGGCALDDGEVDDGVDAESELDELGEYDELAEEDPAGWLDGELMWDEGPLPADEHSDADLDIDGDGTERAAPGFQLPFPCGQTWAGQTRTNHSPVYSVDFNRYNDWGDTVVAAAGGTVTRVENLGATSYGRWIEIAHGNGYTTRYAHLSAQSVHVGQQVARGQKIGEVGSTGGSTGPHLHFEERHNGYAIRVRLNGSEALYFGTRNYTSHNGCGATGRVNTSGPNLLVRSGPSTGATIVGSVPDGKLVTISCQKRGSTVTGTYGTSDLWDRISGGYVADAYIYTGSDGRVAPTCP